MCCLQKHRYAVNISRSQLKLVNTALSEPSSILGGNLKLTAIYRLNQFVVILHFHIEYREMIYFMLVMRLKHTKFLV